MLRRGGHVPRAHGLEEISNELRAGLLIEVAEVEPALRALSSVTASARLPHQCAYPIHTFPGVVPGESAGEKKEGEGLKHGASLTQRSRDPRIRGQPEM